MAGPVHDLQRMWLRGLVDEISNGRAGFDRDRAELIMLHDILQRAEHDPRPIIQRAVVPVVHALLRGHYGENERNRGNIVSGGF